MVILLAVVCTLQALFLTDLAKRVVALEAKAEPVANRNLETIHERVAELERRS